jgi:hypothetical protein
VIIAGIEKFVEFCLLKVTTGQKYRGRDYFIVDSDIAGLKPPG